MSFEQYHFAETANAQGGRKTSNKHITPETSVEDQNKYRNNEKTTTSHHPHYMLMRFMHVYPFS